GQDDGAEVSDLHGRAVDDAVRPARGRGDAAVLHREVRAPGQPQPSVRMGGGGRGRRDRKSTRLNSSHGSISYAVFCLKKQNSHAKLDVQVPSVTSYIPELRFSIHHPFRSPTAYYRWSYRGSNRILLHCPVS